MVVAPHLGGVVDGAGLLVAVEGEDHVEHHVGDGEGAAVVPGDGVVKVVGVGDRALAKYRLGLRVNLGSGEELLRIGVPIHPGIVGHHDLRLEVQRHPVMGLGDG